MNKLITLLLAVWPGLTMVWAQPVHELFVQVRPAEISLNYHDKINSRDALGPEIHSLRRQLFEQGYFLPVIEIDSSGVMSTILIVDAGPRTEWYGLCYDKLDPESRSILPKPRNNKKRPFSQAEVMEQIELLLEYYENRGYPFAEVGLTDLDLKEGILEACLAVERGPLIYIDSIHLKGEANLTEGFQRHMLGLRSGMLYDESVVKRLESQINSASFLRSLRAPEVLFTTEKTHLYVYLEEKKASRFDGIIGLVTKDDGRLQLNGNLLLDLKNSFHKGEEIFLEWQAPGNSSQRLRTSVVLPYLLKTPFWVDARWELQRQDSSYLNQDARIGLRYAPRGWEYWQLKWKIITSTALRTDADRSFTNFRAPYYGLEWNRDPIRNVLVPKQGWFSGIDISYGRRRVEGVDVDQWRYEARMGYFWNFSRSWVLHQKIEGRGLVSPDYLENELIRTGGFHSLRGFPEENFFSAHVWMTRLEQRFIIPGGFLFISGDLAGLVLPEEEQEQIWAGGLAAGMALGSESGQFYLSWAMGAQSGISFGQNGSMIHFGYINQF